MDFAQSRTPFGGCGKAGRLSPRQQRVTIIAVVVPGVGVAVANQPASLARVVQRVAITTLDVDEWEPYPYHDSCMQTQSVVALTGVGEVGP